MLGDDSQDPHIAAVALHGERFRNLSKTMAAWLCDEK